MQIKDKVFLNKLKKLPLFPLHLHWDGSIPARDIFERSKKKGITLYYPEKDRERNIIHYKNEEEKIINSVDKLKNFFMDLNTYHIVDVFYFPVSFMQTKEDLIQMAKAHCKYLKEHNIPYAETRFAPQYHKQLGLSYDEILGYALEGFEAGYEETGVKVGLIISLGREASVQKTKKVVEAVLNYEEKILGIDLATEERGNPPEKHYEAFKLTFDTSLKRTVHAGEMCSEEENLKNIYTSLTLLRADGLGHAIPLFKRYYKQHDLFELVRKNNVRIESNPLSNHILFNYPMDYHNLDVLVKEGVKVTVNPDDPAMWPYGDMVYSLYFTWQTYGWETARQTVFNSIDTAWGLSKEEKLTFKNNFIQKLKETGLN
ncbi:MAG: adenosine deaminase family protein [Candidatus Muiribacteriota bacterium]